MVLQYTHIVGLVSNNRLAQRQHILLSYDNTFVWFVPDSLLLCQKVEIRYL